MTRCDRIVGGASRDRTDDLRIANATLSQLSYGPFSDGQKSPAALLARRLKGATFRRLRLNLMLDALTL
jgi:hypothetical protein